ncbi:MULTISPECIES: hypothetical protein, partial [unclassified Oceanispirochaeta]|uniref:hypothetical protein n=1 Tax=unclassified Oceanispirochaeta TaxID=2635722 RepID=UPI001C12FD05
HNGDYLLIKMSCWRNSGSVLANMAMPNAWFKDLGLFHLTDVNAGPVVPISGYFEQEPYTRSVRTVL